MCIVQRIAGLRNDLALEPTGRAHEDDAHGSVAVAQLVGHCDAREEMTARATGRDEDRARHSVTMLRHVEQQTHRNHREQQILQALEKGLTDVKSIARDIYPRNLKKGLWAGAERNVMTHLEKLKADGVIVEQPAQFSLAR